MTAPIMVARAAAGAGARKKAGATAARDIGKHRAGGSATSYGPKVSTDITSPKAPKSPGDPKYGVELGGLGTGAGKAGKSLSKALDGGPPHRKVLVAEFLVCVSILALSPLASKHSGEGPQAFMKRGAAICALFFILGLVSSGGRGAAKVAAGFGGIVTLALLLSSRDVFAVLAARFNGGPGTAGEGGEGDLLPDGSSANVDVTPDAPGTLPNGASTGGTAAGAGITPNGTPNGAAIPGVSLVIGAPRPGAEIPANRPGLPQPPR